MQKNDEPQPLALGENKRKVWRAQVLSQKQEPQILRFSLPQRVPTMQQYVTKKLQAHGEHHPTEAWVLFPYAGEGQARVSLAACQWLTDHCASAGYLFTETGLLCYNYTTYDGVAPPNEWEEEPE